MELKEFYTTREIAQMYKVTEYTITQNWIPKGLEYFPSKPFKFRIEWVEKYIEEQIKLTQLKRQKPICEIVKSKKLAKIPKFNSDMKINIEDYLSSEVKKDAI